MIKDFIKNLFKKKEVVKEVTGDERIISIADKLEKELINQGYKVGTMTILWHFEGKKIQVETEGREIGGGYINE